MDAPADLLRLYEDDVLVPMVQKSGLEPVREAVDFALTPGTIAALMNSAKSFTYTGDVLHWTPLSVIYSDHHGATGTVFSLTATFNPKTETVRFQQAKLHGIVTLVRQPKAVSWVNPYSGKEMVRFPLAESDKILLNSWLLFQGAILPLLRAETYRFAGEREKFAFQASMIRHISSVYRDAF